VPIIIILDNYNNNITIIFIMTLITLFLFLTLLLIVIYLVLNNKDNKDNKNKNNEQFNIATSNTAGYIPKSKIDKYIQQNNDLSTPTDDVNDLRVGLKDRTLRPRERDDKEIDGSSGSFKNVFKETVLGPTYEEIVKDRTRNTIDANLFTDITFNDVVVYDNNPNGRLGIDKCYDNIIDQKRRGIKEGACVEFGIGTGIAYYYPPVYNDENYGQIITDELTPLEKRQPTIGTITYPNLR
jgi:hypothetical protein